MRASSRLRSSPPWKGEAGRGDAPGPADRTGVSRPPPCIPAAPPSLLPPGRGAGGDDPPPPTGRAPARGTPLPTSPLEGGRREEKGGGEKAAAVRLLVRRRGRTCVLAVTLLPPGRGEVGRGDDPGSADRTGVSRPPPCIPAAPPSLLPPGRGVGGDNPAAHRPRAAGAGDPPPDLPPGRGEERRQGGEERGRRRCASRSGVGGERASSRLRSSPLEGGRSGGGMPRAPQTGRGVPRPPWG